MLFLESETQRIQGIQGTKIRRLCYGMPNPVAVRLQVTQSRAVVKNAWQLVQSKTTIQASQEAYELEQVLDSIADSVRAEMAPAPPPEEVVDMARCPISCDIMGDPVILKDSGITYDRSSIKEWMRLGHRRDPVTNAEIVTGELIGNTAMRGLSRMISGDDAEEIVVEEAKPKPELMPGVYEGFGSYRHPDASEEHVFAVLVLEPDGNVQGYVSMCSGEEKAESEARVLVGKWNDQSDSLYFAGAAMFNQGKVTIAESSQQLTFSLCGDSGPASNPADIVAQFQFKHMTSPPLLYNYLVLPGLLEMEGTIKAVDGSQSKNKLVLVLDGDGSLRGWMSAEKADGDRLVAHVLRGTWDSTGLLSFSLYFPHPKLPMESVQTPAHYLACYKLVGDVGEAEYPGGSMSPSFSGTVKRMPNAPRTPKHNQHPIPGIGLNKSAMFEYNCFSLSLCLLHQ